MLILFCPRECRLLKHGEARLNFEHQKFENKPILFKVTEPSSVPVPVGISSARVYGTGTFVARGQPARGARIGACARQRPLVLPASSQPGPGSLPGADTRLRKALRVSLQEHLHRGTNGGAAADGAIGDSILT